MPLRLWPLRRWRRRTPRPPPPLSTAPRRLRTDRHRVAPHVAALVPPLPPPPPAPLRPPPLPQQPCWPLPHSARQAPRPAAVTAGSGRRRSRRRARSRRRICRRATTRCAARRQACVSCAHWARSSPVLTLRRTRPHWRRCCGCWRRKRANRCPPSSSWARAPRRRCASFWRPTARTWRRR